MLAAARRGCVIARGSVQQSQKRGMAGMAHEEVVALWKSAKAVCFDVDSTVVTEEGIDVLAEHCGAGEAVAAWTRKAMGGSVPFHEALEARLNLFGPSVKDIQDCNTKHPLELTPGIADLIATLHERNVHVYLVSGGFRQMINPLADILNISRDRIYANNLLFKDDGSFAGFDPEEPTSRAGGKAKVVQTLKEAHGYDPIFMIGDGATDMEARPPADAFIGFGGVAVREVVKEGADWFVTDMNDLIKPLKE
ncbi:Phosphoserine phosphatase [Hondaea fermentalgiana]|uniref:phosphoserine phosphatase n=1 Tax=Hondaea fermentalgiana TaxID=2315210 RepID=A0A2R5GSD3_9STRA|nr:Phosphoserine phosphatase [Hondaea fermentalgiana]|eukprot:GBG32668.1 Phosphoserine phosphatase [Hondaea fermentalgiana]